MKARTLPLPRLKPIAPPSRLLGWARDAGAFLGGLLLAAAVYALLVFLAFAFTHRIDHHESANECCVASQAP